MLRNALSTQTRKYHLAFNHQAKARPNFGLTGVGYHTSDVYFKQGQHYWAAICVVAPLIIVNAIMYQGFFSKLDEIAGGGPQVLDYGWRKNDRNPWDFAFDIGEGFVAGEPRYRPAPGAVPLH